ncbi:hypothetical protein CYMTET_5948 [Cymbomonas tetramitiformis]|uniref:Uncharacterized protein n=1 Tax=Cymbomonas tetramitiformis TaxID=36881 RepID=A0AAE0GY79_9CHLO|nr:hypothetical protein CYMTET_5948 [Cymbomonas tetramitiformis]
MGKAAPSGGLVGRTFRVLKDEWPEYSEDCPEIGYWTGKIIRRTKKSKVTVYESKIVEDGEAAETWEFSFERVKARLVLLDGEVRGDLQDDRRRRSSSGRQILSQSVAGGSRDVANPVSRRASVARAQACFQPVDAEITPTKLAALAHSLPEAREETSSDAVHTTPNKKRVADPSKWGRIRKRFALGFKFRSPLRPHEEACSPRCTFECGSSVSEAHRVGLRQQLDDQYKPKGWQGVIALLHCLAKKEPKNTYAASRGFIGRKQLTAVRSGSISCRYCRLGEGSVADRPLIPALRKHNFTRLVARKKRGILVESGCPYHAEGEAYFVAKEAEYHSRTSGVLGAVSFYLPGSTISSGAVRVCWPFFRNTFGLGKKAKVITSIVNLDQSHVLPPVPATRKTAEIARAKGVATFNTVKEHLKKFPRESSHYSNNMNHGASRYFLAPDLYPAKLWQLFCYQECPDFAEQAEAMGWWRSLDSEAKKPPKMQEAVEDGLMLLKPTISYPWYLALILLFDIDFGRVKADVSYDSRNQDGTKTKADYPAPLPNHLKPAYNSLKKTETQSQDFGGNLRTPKLTVGEAFYLRILATFCYSIYSYARRCTVLYFWNEKIAEKGANNCVSVEHYQHLHYPSGAVHLVKWFDGTAGQCNNGTMHRYNTEITDPDIPEMFMYERMDVKVPPTGHTYLINDTWFGAIQRAAKTWSVISDLDDWVEIAAGSSRLSPPICVVPEQGIHRDWNAYLSQRYVKTTRKDKHGDKVNISEFHWFNYGIGEVVGQKKADGTPVLASHPGEIWMRRTLEESEPWTIVDLRKEAPSNHALWGTGIRTRDLPVIPNLLPITDPSFQLYNAPLLITKAKVKDLHQLSKYFPNLEKRAQYPEHVVGMPCKDDKDTVTVDSDDDPEPQVAEADIECPTILPSDVDISSSDDSDSSLDVPLASRKRPCTDSDSSIEEPLAVRKRRLELSP